MGASSFLAAFGFSFSVVVLLPITMVIFMGVYAPEAYKEAVRFCMERIYMLFCAYFYFIMIPIPRVQPSLSSVEANAFSFLFSRTMSFPHVT